jgi:hypothetical protein
LCEKDMCKRWQGGLEIRILETKLKAIFVASLLLLAHGQAASAQPAQCPVCRAEYRYGHCPETGINNPPRDTIAFTGIVTAAEPIDCGVRITVDVKRSSARSLPAKIAIDVLPCSFWNGAIGDGISAAVLKERKQPGVYAASIHCAGTR